MMKWHGDVFRHYRTLELKVPEDVSVIGYDDSTLSAYYGVPLTTVHSPIVEMGSASANELFRLLNSEETKVVQ